MKLLDTIYRESGEYPCRSTINPEGTRLYVVYQLELAAYSVNVLVAELFDISGGKLVSIAKYLRNFVVGGFNSVLDGHANSDFSRFTVLIADLNNNCKVFLLKYDKLTNALVETDSSSNLSVLSAGFTGLGAEFVDNDKLILVSGVNPATAANNNQDSFFYALNSGDLEIENTFTVKSTIFTTTSLALNCCDKSYFAIASSQGKFDFDDQTSNWTPKHRLVVYSIKKVDGAVILKEFSSQPLSQGALVINSSSYSDEFTIFVGTATALFSNEKAIPIFSSNTKAASGTSGDELVLFKFKCGCQLEPVCSVNTNSNVDGGLYLSVSDKLVFSQQNDSGSSLQLAKLNDCCLKDLTLASPIGSLPSINSDEKNKYLVVAAASNEDANVNNVLLYKL